jgi:hypothetical protein
MTFPFELSVMDEAAELLRVEYDLPELADSAAEADALATANAYLGALRHVEADEASAEAELRATITLLTSRHADRMAALADRATYLRDILELVYRAFPATGKAKSRKLLAGTLGTRTKPARWQVDDAEVLVAWAQETAPSAVSLPSVKPRVLVSDLAEWASRHPDVGEVPGAHCEPATDEFFAKPA